MSGAARVVSRRRFLGAATLTPLLAVACRRAPPRPLRVVFPTPPVSLDPHVTNESVSFAVNSNLYDPLLESDAAQRLVPALATRWLNPDDLTWTFELRADRRFHDGRPVRPEDVAWSLLRQRDDPQSEWRDGLVGVVAVEPEPGRVRIRTSRPQATVASRLLGSFVAPAGSTDLAARPVGSGPYRLAGRSGDELRLAAVPGDPRATQIPELVFASIADEPARLEAIVRGDADLVTDVPARDIARLSAVPGLHVLQAQASRQLFLGFDVAGERTPHTDLPRNPFRDLRVREAVQSAIDVPALVQEVYAGAAEPATWIAAPGVAGFDATRRPPPHDRERSRRLLAQAGFPAGFQVTLHAPKGVYPGDEQVAAAVARDLQAVGIAARVAAEEKAVFFDRLRRGDTSLYLMAWNCLSGDAQEVLDFLLHTPDRARGYGSENVGGYSNPGLDRAAEEAVSTMSARRRIEKLKQAAALALDDVATVPLVVQRQIYALRDPFVWTPRGDRRVRGVDVISAPAGG